MNGVSGLRWSAVFPLDSCPSVVCSPLSTLSRKESHSVWEPETHTWVKLNKSKSNIGAISKRILDRINCQLRNVTQINQFKSTNEVLVWFKNLENKQNLKFIKLDIEQFYPSISLDLLMKALEWARPLAYFTDKEKNTIIHCRRHFLFFNSKTYVKKKIILSLTVELVQLIQLRSPN